MLHARETCAPTLPKLHLLQRNDRSMIHMMCDVTTKDQTSSQDLDRMQVDDLAKALRARRLRWHIHVECSDGWLKKFWTEVICFEYPALGLTPTHTTGKLGVLHLDVLSDLVHQIWPIPILGTN